MVDGLQQCFRIGIATFQTKHRQAKVTLGTNLKIVIATNQRFEMFCPLNTMPDVLLKTSHAVGSDYEPQFQCSKSSTQWNLPMLFRQKTMMLIKKSS